MNIRVLTVGKADVSLKAFEEDFYKRLRSFATFDVVELPEGKARQASQRKQEEEKHILKAVRPRFVLFDERGASFSSRDWAGFLEQQHGGEHLDFVIGGASGVSDAIRQQAAAVWSLSPLTLPHKLVRVLVVEQLYRAFTILSGHPYHRD